MLHRVTWYAAGLLALVAVASTVGYWGAGQSRESNALVRSANVAYGASFEDLVSNVSNMKEELASSLLTSNQTIFDSHVAGVSRFAYAADIDLAKLPKNDQSLSQLHAYLNGIDASARSWIAAPNSAANRSVRKSVSTNYSVAQKVETQLRDLETQLGQSRLSWTNRATSSSNERDPTALVAMRKVNSTLASVNGLAAEPSKASSVSSTSTSSGPVTAQQAVNLVKGLAHTDAVESWTSKIANSPNSGSVFEVWGKHGNTIGLVHGVVSRQNGRLLSFRNTRTISTVHVDITQGAKDALSWLQQRGYPNVVQTDASEYDHEAVFTFEQMYQHLSVVDQPIKVYVALDNRQVVGFTGREAALHPVVHVLKSRLTTRQLQQRLSNDFHVQMERDVLMNKGQTQTYEPAVAFYGTMKDETYCMYLSAVDGHEIRVKHLV